MPRHHWPSIAALLGAVMPGHAGAKFFPNLTHGDFGAAAGSKGAVLPAGSDECGHHGFLIADSMCFQARVRNGLP